MLNSANLTRKCDGKNGMLLVESSDDATTTTLTVLGALTPDRKRIIARTVRCTQHTGTAVVLDLRRCESCDSGTLGFIVDCKRSLNERFALMISETGALRRIVEIAGLSRAFA